MFSEETGSHNFSFVNRKETKFFEKLKEKNPDLTLPQFFNLHKQLASYGFKKGLYADILVYEIKTNKKIQASINIREYKRKLFNKAKEYFPGITEEEFQEYVKISLKITIQKLDVFDTQRYVNSRKLNSRIVDDKAVKRTIRHKRKLQRAVTDIHTRKSDHTVKYNNSHIPDKVAIRG